MPVKNVAKQFGSKPKLSTDKAGILVDKVKRDENILVDCSFKLLRGGRNQRLHCLVVTGQVRVFICQCLN